MTCNTLRKVAEWVRSTPHQIKKKCKLCLDLCFISFAHFSKYVKFVAVIKQKKNFKKNTSNLLGAQTISIAPNENVKAKIFSATKDVDPPREI